MSEPTPTAPPAAVRCSSRISLSKELDEVSLHDLVVANHAAVNSRLDDIERGLQRELRKLSDTMSVSGLTRANSCAEMLSRRDSSHKFGYPLSARGRQASFMSSVDGDSDRDQVYTLSRTASRPDNHDDAASAVAEMRSSKSQSPERERPEDESGAAAAAPASGSAISFNVEAGDGKQRWPTVRVRRPSKGAGQAEGTKDMMQSSSFRARASSFLRKEEAGSRFAATVSKAVKKAKLVSTDSFKSGPSTPRSARRTAPRAGAA